MPKKSKCKKRSVKKALIPYLSEVKIVPNSIRLRVMSAVQMKKYMFALAS